jgi:16S rRNA (guanine966-N2)-methyltransferase
VRVVAGSLRGRRLQAPAAAGTRPTSDRVREAIFNALASLDAVTDAVVLDLFAGSGALGIEALSRGAALCTFVESARPALRTLRANLDALGLADRATVAPMNVDRFLASSPHADLALADPPYAFDNWAGVMGALDAALLVAESDRLVEPAPGWELVREKRYGTTHVTFLRRTDAESPGETR